MEMITVSVRMPRDMAPYIKERNNELTFEQSAMLLYPLVQNLTISHGRAAEILGVHKYDLIDFYASMGFPYLNQSIDDLEEELSDIHSFEGANE